MIPIDPLPPISPSVIEALLAPLTCSHCGQPIQGTTAFGNVEDFVRTGLLARQSDEVFLHVGKCEVEHQSLVTEPTQDQMEREAVRHFGRALLAALFWALRWFIPRPPVPDPIVDRNEKCPACGYREGKLKCVRVATEKQHVTGDVLVEHTCCVCSANWFSPTVLGGTPQQRAQLIHPADERLRIAPRVQAAPKAAKPEKVA